jgi:hypothetical protein
MTFQKIQQNFNSRSFDFESISLWLLGVSIIALLILLILAVKKLRAGRRSYQPEGSVDDPKAILAILKETFDQRRTFEVQLHTEAGHRRPTLRCTPEYLGKSRITIAVSGLESLSQRWVGRPVMVFFRLMLHNTFVYYTFASQISGISNPKRGVCHISLPLPERLDNRQKRSFLRINPPHEFILGSALWCGDHMPRPETFQDFFAWPRPKLLHIPHRVQQLQLLDISAGGARIGIEHKVLRRYKLKFNTLEQVILMLDLFDSDQGKRLRLWTLCRVQNQWREHSTRDVQLGLQFLAWGRPQSPNAEAENSGGVEWLRLSSANEIEGLGNWIMRRHLELFRDTPAEK